MDGAQSLTVTLETVTPLFLGGADPRGAPELRAPSFRGAMRYWLRALVGAASEVEMKRYEDQLFGVGGDQARAGAVSLHLSPPKITTRSYSQLTSNRTGTGYLWFAARSTKAEPERAAIVTATFQLTLAAPRSRQPEKDLEQAAATLWLLTRLGGVGSRSRRFAGGVRALQVEPASNTNSLIARLPKAARTPEELAQEISEGIRAARRAFDISALPPSATDQFDVLHPQRCQIYVLRQSFPSWSDAIERVGRVYQNFRKVRRPDYTVVKQAMINGEDLNGTVERAAFGLPIPFFYRSLQNRTSTLQAEHHNEKIDRRASPLWMRAVRLDNGQCAVVFTWFKSRFLPESTRLLLTERHQDDLQGNTLPTDQLINTFLRGNDAQNNSSLKDADYDLLEINLR